MATLPAIATDVELMPDPNEALFWEMIRHHEYAPYYDPAEGINNRLNKAARVVYEARITPNSDQSYTIEGSNGHLYRVHEHCSCPDSTYRKDRPCYHEVAVRLYVEWQRRQRPLAAAHPDDATLPLGPASIEERLAQTTLGTGIGSRESGVGTAPPSPTTPDSLLPTPVPHEEPEMTEDPSAYIPEPDEAPVAVLEQPKAAVVPVSTQVHDLEQALQDWTTQRAIVQRFLKHQLIAGTDYYQLRIGKVDSKPSLSKAGAEKVLSWLKWSASFTPDTGTWEMLGRPTDLVCYVCTLHTRTGEVVGEGRGARSLKKDGGDINKAIKMAEKSSMVSAVLRTGALSDCFTQDLEDMQDPAPASGTAPTSAAELRGLIWAQLKAQAPEVTTREQAGRWVKERTGYALVESNFPAILHALAVG